MKKLMLKPITLDPNLAINMLSAPELPDDIVARVDTIWNDALLERESLFDGAILSVVSLSVDKLVLTPLSYRHALAALIDRSLRPLLRVRPLAVTGILTCPDGIVFGRRAKLVTQGAGLLELVPSGGVEAPNDGGAVNLSYQILRELREEIGLSLDQVKVHHQVGAIENFNSGVFDIAIPISTELTFNKIADLHKSRGTKEYTELSVTPSPRDFAQGRNDILEVSLTIIENFI